MKRTKILYWIFTGLFSLMITGGAMMYFIQHDMVAEMLTALGYPVFIIYPLATAKLLGVTAIVSNKSKMLKEFAYAGFFFELLLAIQAHIMAGDGGFPGPLAALTLVVVSYVFWKKSEASTK